MHIICVTARWFWANRICIALKRAVIVNDSEILSVFSTELILQNKLCTTELGIFLLFYRSLWNVKCLTHFSLFDHGCGTLFWTLFGIDRKTDSVRANCVYLMKHCQMYWIIMGCQKRMANSRNEKHRKEELYACVTCLGWQFIDGPMRLLPWLECRRARHSRKTHSFALSANTNQSSNRYLTVTKRMQ